MKNDPFIEVWVSEVGQVPGPGHTEIEYQIAKKWFKLGKDHNEELRAEIERLSALLKDVLG
jgi:hypothetical protein